MRKKLIHLLYSTKSDPAQTIFIIALLVLYGVYFYSRALDDSSFAVSWFCGVCFSLCALFHPKLSAFIRRNYRIIIIIAAFIWLIYSSLNYRTNSWDGMNLYYRSTYMVKEKLHSGVLQGALLPYLSELFLGVVDRLFGDIVMFLLFGVVALLNLFTSYVLYKRLGFSRFTIKCSLLILASSSTYIMLSIHEFKVELFLLFLCNLFILLLKKLIDNPCHKTAVLLGIVASLCFLVKVTVFPLVILAPLIILLVLIVRKEQSFPAAARLLGVFVITFLTPVFMWLLYAPTYLPVMGEIDLLNRKSHLDFTDLERNTELQVECENRGRYRDLSDWIYFENDLWFLVQPFQYLFLVGLNKSHFGFAFGNPGPFIYFGIWLLPIVLIYFKKNRDFGKFLLYVSTFPFIITIYYLSKTVFWYLFPVFPLLSTVVPVLAERYIRAENAKTIFKAVLLSSFFTHGLLGSVYAMNWFTPYPNVAESSPILWKLSKYAQNLPENYYILDASEHIYLVFLPFMNNYDTRLVKSNYYFVSSEKGLDTMRQELLNKNIKYIIARKRTLFDKWYTGCPLRNNEILFRFLEKHTVQIYDSVQAGEIYEII